MENKDLKQNDVEQESPEQNVNQEKMQGSIQEPAEQKEELVLVVKNKTTGLEVIYKLQEGKELVVGASPECSACLDDPYVSSKHFSVMLKEGKIDVEDLGSRNGTFRKLNKETISIDSILLAGKSVFKFEKRISDETK